MTESAAGVDPVVLGLEHAHAISRWVASPADVILFAGTGLRWPVRPDDLLAMAADPARHTYVLADAEHRPVATGSVVLREPDRAARIARVLVDPGRRGEGFGRAMMEFLIAIAEARPWVRQIGLAVWEHNTPARDLYERLGFRATGERNGLVVDGSRWVSVEMTRPARRSQRTGGTAAP